MSSRIKALGTIRKLQEVSYSTVKSSKITWNYSVAEFDGISLESSTVYTDSEGVESLIEIRSWKRCSSMVRVPRYRGD